MKILSCFLDNRFGGPQARSHLVAQELRKSNIETVFLFNQKLKGHIPIEGFDCFLLKHMQCISRTSTALNLFLFCLLLPWNIYRICKLIESEKIDVVHANGIMNVLPPLVAKLNKTKVIWYLNDTLTPLVVRKLLLPVLRLLSDKIAVAAKKVGQHYFDDIDKFWNKTVILYPPVDTFKFSSNSVDIKKVKRLKAELNIPPDRFVVGALGNINMSKGYEYFIGAAKQIEEKVKNVKFLIVGAKLDTKREYWDKLYDLALRSGLEDDIIFTGFRKDIPEVLSILDVFVLSSVTEACPNTVLEAMAMKVPIVATDVGGVSEQVVDGETAIIVRPRDSSAIASGVIDMLETPKEIKGKMIEKGRKRAENIFALGDIVEQYRRIYQQISL